LSWSSQQFKEKIYNDEYVRVDPDFVETRPKENASSLISAFGETAHLFKHLDYGGGNGLLSQLLVEANFQSMSYDPFANQQIAIEQLGKFDLITAYEVFEHVPDVQQLMSNLCALLAPSGIILFSTLLSDGNIHPKQRLSWWYASPRNGHISLFSRQSLFFIAQQKGFKFGSFSEDLHIFFNHVPPWANHIIKT
jgi:SAM-dependent methyltransferase